MKNWKSTEWSECIVWILVIGIIGTHHAFHFPAVIHNFYTGQVSGDICHYLLPSAKHEGCGGFSYMTLTTGLNLALVKFEVFVKTLKEIEDQWNDEIAAQMRTFPAAQVDDASSQLIDQYLINHVQEEKRKAYAEHKRLGLHWRWLAIRLTVLGLVLLFFQYSAGLLGLLFVLPVLGSVHAKRKCKTRLNETLATLKNFAESVYKGQGERRSEVDKTIKSA